MSLQNQQNLLAKLYTDAELRRAFLSQPDKIGAENHLNEIEIAEIAAIMPEEIEFFAETLFWKRLREVEKLLPLTKKVLSGDFTKLFRKFAPNYNPQTVKKHFEDALEFCRFLRRQTISELANNTAKFEQSKLEFFGGGKRFVICKLDIDIREIYDSEQSTAKLNLEKKTKIAVWLKVGKKHKHFFI